MTLRQAPVVPTSTYRLQLQPKFTFNDAAGVVPYLAQLGVSHLYLSPILQATPGSTHGYDVIDHRYLADQLGGAEGFLRLSDAARNAGLGIIVDVVPNHMAVPTPAGLNPAMWSILRYGPQSDYSTWVDVRWDTDHSTFLMPVLGDRIGNVLARGELRVDAGEDGNEPVLRYFDHELPIRPGTEHLPLEELVGRQWYRLAYWKIANEELNYRRFFDIDTLAAVRVEDPDVFAGTHQTLLALRASGRIDGFRVDHPDGLTDPRGYLQLLAKETDASWVVVEKILGNDETLPGDWETHGTTGYDALMRVGALFEAGDSAAELHSFWRRFSGVHEEFTDVVDAAKRDIIADSLPTEVERLVDLLVDICRTDVRLRDHSRRGLTESVTELLVAMDRYRAYVTPGEDPTATAERVITAATGRAQDIIDPEYHDTLSDVSLLALGKEAGSAGMRFAQDRVEFCIRFQQTCGPVMAKGVEDTAFYRWFPFPGRNEVGGHPAALGMSVDEFHGYAQRLQRDMPLTMTTLTTHDTKRSEDLRAVLATLTEEPAEWTAKICEWSESAADFKPPTIDSPTEYLLWHTLIGLATETELPAAGRVVAYFQKACREAKRLTSWTNPDEAYEEAVAGFIADVLNSRSITDSILAYRRSFAEALRVNVLGQKIVQLTMPGVPDVYQGTEVVQQTLVDPDNRVLVDFRHMDQQLASISPSATNLSLDAEKHLVTSSALAVRNMFPEVFVGPDAEYAPVPSTTSHVVAFQRSAPDHPSVVTVATRLPRTAYRLVIKSEGDPAGRWGGHELSLAGGRWRDVLTGNQYPGGAVSLSELLALRPVALLVS